MATNLQPLFIILFLVTVKHLVNAQTTPNNLGLLLKVSKDHQTNQYTTHLLIGTPQLPTKLVINLSGQSLWLNCQPPSPSPSRTVITHRSIKCSMAKPGSQKIISSTICNNIHQQNPFTGETSFGYLVEDIVTVDGMRPISTVDQFLFSCAPHSLLNGLVNGAKGVLGFGKSNIDFQSQLVSNFDFPRKFIVCLSPSTGFIFSDAGFGNSGTGSGNLGTSSSASGTGSETSGFIAGSGNSGTISGDVTGVFNSLSYTPLIRTHGVSGYYVNVNAIKINGRRLAGLVAGKPICSVEISSTVPYTVMKSTLYGVFVKGFVASARSMNMTVVSPVAPFGVCFSSLATGTVPEIELVLQSELMKWRIQRRNSMVRVSDSVMCLGFIDGGSGMNSQVVLGGYQLEDHLLEFNLGTGMMGFSSSLLMKGNSCSKIRASISTRLESL